MWKSLALGLPLAILPAVAYAQAPKVVASIAPLHSLAAMVMDGVATPQLLLDGATSVHGYSLKPSDVKAIETAQILVIADEHLETFLAKAVKARSGKLTVLSMADLPGMTLLPQREGGVWEAHSHGHEDEHGHDEHGHDEHGHDEGDMDSHVWLDPANARILLAALTEQLVALDPEHAQRYRSNAEAAQTRLTALDQDLKARLAPLKDRPYVVFHAAYQYFEQRYQLSPAGSITLDPDRPPSAKRVAELRAKLNTAKAACVFREPQFPAPMVETLAQSANAKVGVLDPLGTGLPPGPGLYPTLLGNLADSLTNCLSSR